MRAALSPVSDVGAAQVAASVRALVCSAAFHLADFRQTIFSRRSKANRRVTFRRFGARAQRAGELLGVFAIVLGARLWLIERTGSEVPILDQWDAEGAFLLKPFVEGSLRLADLFVPHNE